jgi:cytochrome P450
MAWGVVAMLHFPECAHRAQAEIDEVVGPDRMPNFQDQRSLPYLDGFIKETLRSVESALRPRELKTDHSI